MRRSLSVIIILVFLFVTTVTASLANSRHYSTGHGSHHHYSYRGHSHHSDHIWAGLGIGLLTGAVIGSVLYQIPEEQTIIYKTAPPHIIYVDPATVEPPYPTTPPQPQVVLRRVKTTAELLNIRSAPGVDAAIFSQLEQNTILDVLGAAPDWLYVRTETGLYGWVMAEYTTEAEGPVG